MQQNSAHDVLAIRSITLTKEQLPLLLLGTVLAGEFHPFYDKPLSSDSRIKHTEQAAGNILVEFPALYPLAIAVKFPDADLMGFDVLYQPDTSK